jgi:hypothetical protein
VESPPGRPRLKLTRQYRPKVHAAGNKLRADVREEVGMILAVLKG